MSKGRLEAFSDGVIAILITIMVLELHPPTETTFEALAALAPVFISYVLSFAYLGIYWNNHHHLLQAARTVDGSVLWANLHLLFWLSLFPFATAWMGEGLTEAPIAAQPMALYGGVLLMAALAYTILVRALQRCAGQSETIAVAAGADRKGVTSLVLYAAAIPVALVLDLPLVSFAMYAIVAVIWFIPDRRVERALGR